LATGQRAVSGSIARIKDVLAGCAGTQVCVAMVDGVDSLCARPAIPAMWWGFVKQVATSWLGD
jgi:hypothetical protein